MPRNRAVRVFFVAIGLITLILIAGIVSISALRWRAEIVFDKATGQMSDIAWADLSWLLRRGSPVDLKIMAETKNPFLAIWSPLHSAHDIEAGGRLFREHCATCHGDQGIGGAGGPSLHNRIFRRGRSDWALFQTTTLGLPGTAMPGQHLPRNEVWQLVSYLRIVVLAPSAAGGAGSTPVVAGFAPVSAMELEQGANHPKEWLTYSGSYDSQRHSRLNQINRHNVPELRVEWERQLATSVEKVETTPIVRGTTMFVTEPPNRVLALNAVTGRVLWEYSHELPARLPLCCGPVNRGVALLGNRVFVGTLDAHLVALDATTGSVLWEIEVADVAKGFSITGAPLVVGDMVLTGVGGGEFGIRGFVDAYDAASGQRRWRFYTIPEPGEPGSDTWKGDSFRRGGGPTWLTGSYDPELRLLYWTVGNASPNFDGDARSGDNLYSDSIVALDIDSGKLRWYFQFSPHDTHDWDANQIPVLADGVVAGQKRKTLLVANRNAFYYELDRATGEFLLGGPYVKQTWADGLDAKGRPRVRPGSAPSREGSVVYPSLMGATNWWSPSYDSELGLLYVPTVTQGGIFYLSPDKARTEEGFILGGSDTKIPNEDLVVTVKAIEATTGRVRWEYSRPPRKTNGDMLGGLLSTSGGLVFGGDMDDFFALDASTGKELWRFPTGGQISGAPMSYEVNGREYVAIAAGRAILSFALPPPRR
jgi:alcohol dehydrogenase (cytochrome c)